MNYNYRSQSWALFLLLGINVFVFALTLLIPPVKVRDEIEVFGALHFFYIEHGGLWLLLTANFLHFNLWHFIVNMLALYQIGTLFETIYDSKKLVVTYVIGGIFSSIATYAVLAVNEDFNTAVGASGAIFALLGVLIGGALKKRRYGSYPLDFSAFVPTIVLAVIISFMPGINWAGHIGGLIAGLVMSQIFSHSYLNTVSQKEDDRVDVAFKFSLGIIVVCYLMLVANIFLKIVSF